MKNPWFRLYAEFAADPKVQSMTETFQRRLVMLFCLRCSEDLRGLTEDEIRYALRISPQEFSKTKNLFIEKGFILPDFTIVNWDKRQFISDDITQRVQKHREKVKRFRNVTETEMKRPCNKNETPPDTDTDTEADTEKEKRTIPPTSSGNGEKPYVKIAMQIATNIKDEWFYLPQEKADKFQECYPAVDVMVELRKMQAWSIANPKKCKTKAGMLRFINSWLSKEQDKGGNMFSALRAKGILRPNAETGDLIDQWKKELEDKNAQ